MFPRLFELCAADPALSALLGDNPFRLFPAGDAPQSGDRPYAVWQVASGGPENYLNQRPNADRFLIQLDVYAPKLADARAIGEALRDVVEPVSHVVAFRGESREEDTRLFRVSFDVEWIELPP